jgi:hypothetical protein
VSVISLVELRAVESEILLVQRAGVSRKLSRSRAPLGARCCARPRVGVYVYIYMYMYVYVYVYVYSVCEIRHCALLGALTAVLRATKRRLALRHSNWFLTEQLCSIATLKHSKRVTHSAAKQSDATSIALPHAQMNYARLPSM